MLIKSGLRPGTARRFAPGNRNSLARWRALWRVPICRCLIAKGGYPLSHFPPKRMAANGVRCQLFFSRSAVRERWTINVDWVGAPSGNRPALRAGFRSAARAARRPRSGRGWGRGTRLPALLAGKSKLPRALARTSASSDLSLFDCERGVPPFTLSPEIAGSEQSSLPVVFFAFGSTGTPVFTPAQRTAGPRAARCCLLSWDATAGPHRENWPPVSDRHRAEARNQPR